MKVMRISYKALLLLLAGALLMAGCSPAAFRQLLTNRRAETNTMAESIVTAIETQDREALRALFSEQALAEADDIERGMDYVFSLYGGGVSFG
jgi:uncharacterized lipoprotein YajG